VEALKLALREEKSITHGLRMEVGTLSMRLSQLVQERHWLVKEAAVRGDKEKVPPPLEWEPAQSVVDSPSPTEKKEPSDKPLTDLSAFLGGNSAVETVSSAEQADDLPGSTQSSSSDLSESIASTRISIVW
jgi:hypothetical protein